MKNNPGSASLFSYLTDHHRDLLDSSCRELAAKRGAVILHQEEESFDLYLILSGSVVVSLLHEDGREVVLDMLREGDVFGEMSVLNRLSRSAMVTAHSDVKMLFLSRENFLKIVMGHPHIALELLSVMATRLRKANERIETLTFLDVAGRVSKLLIDLAKTGGESLSDGSVRIKCPTHETIAKRIGSSREAVTKALKSLASNGQIAVTGREVVISPRQFDLS